MTRVPGLRFHRFYVPPVHLPLLDANSPIDKPLFQPSDRDTLVMQPRGNSREATSPLRVLTYFRHGITNAMSEGFNSRIQSIKSQARGFRAFDNYRIRILFYCGKLDLVPSEITH